MLLKIFQNILTSQFSEINPSMIDEGEAYLRVCFSQGWLHGCRRWEEFDLKNADYHFKLEGITALLKKMDYHDVTIAIDGSVKM